MTGGLQTQQASQGASTRSGNKEILGRLSDLESLVTTRHSDLDKRIADAVSAAITAVKKSTSGGSATEDELCLPAETVKAIENSVRAAVQRDYEKLAEHVTSELASFREQICNLADELAAVKA